MDVSAFRLTNPAGLYDSSANAYSHVADVRAGSRLLFVAGQGGEKADGHLSPTFAAQARQALDNLTTALASQGAGLEHVCKLTLLVVNHNQARLAEWVEVAGQAWAGRLAPVCTLIPVPRLALDGMLVEVDAVAALP